MQHEISPEALRPGHQVGTRFATKFGPNGPERIATKFAQVDDVSPCPGQWRTHVHVRLKGSSIPGCHDTRVPVIVQGKGRPS